jgi:hypothetical protein
MSDCKDDARTVEVAEIAAIMRTEGGRNFVLRLLEKTGYFGDTFDSDPIKHAYNAGRRSIGLNLVRELSDSANGEFKTMLKEHFKDE